jgi:hypothetical protein
MNEEYVAGLFDGEGSIGRYAYRASKNGKVYYRLHVRISSNDRWLLEEVQKEFGGSIHPKYNSKPRGNRQQSYDLHWAFRKAEKFLNRILPFLVLKKEKASRLLKEQYG